MATDIELKRMSREIADEVQAVMDDPRLRTATKSLRLEELSDRSTAIEKGMKDNQRARTILGGVGGDSLSSGGGFTQSTSGAFTKGHAPSVRPDAEQMGWMHDSLMGRKSLKIELKAPTDLSSNIPAVLQPGIVQARHEPSRIMSHIPAGPMSAPSIEYLRHNSTTGTATTVAAGALKPEVTMNIDQVLARASKIAVTASMVDENFLDFPSFSEYLSSELTRIVIDAENNQLLNGDGLGTNVLGLRNLTGTIVRPKGTDTSLDAVEQGIADLRTGPAFAVCDVIILHPTTFSALRRTKDSQGRYLLNPDPAASEAENLWGVPVVNTTTCPVGEAVLMASEMAAMAHIRQGITLEMTPYSGTDFVNNVTRFRCEERIALALPRPAAIARVTGLA